jgi:hypothetical protein
MENTWHPNILYLTKSRLTEQKKRKPSSGNSKKGRKWWITNKESLLLSQDQFDLLNGAYKYSHSKYGHISASRLQQKTECDYAYLQKLKDEAANLKVIKRWD